MPFLGSATEARVRVARFRHEAQVLAYLTVSPDSDIPTLYQVGEHQGQPYLVREFVEGRTLEQLVAGGALALREGLGLLARIATVVKRVHGLGFAHRNLQPSNILVTADGAPKVVGFGIVGYLTSSKFLPPGATGVPAEVDVRGLQAMLGWLCGTLRQPVPPLLRDVQLGRSVGSVEAFAEVLGGWLRES
jgi:serine/threonine protein kinase